MTKEAGTEAKDRAAILALIAAIDKGHADRDAGAITAAYAADASIYDLAPPLGHALDAAQLAQWLAGWQGPVAHRSRDFDVTVAGDLAFAHGFQHLSATTAGGEDASWWQRATLCLRREAAGWRIVHEHTSVPFHMDGSFRAATDLEP